MEGVSVEGVTVEGVSVKGVSVKGVSVKEVSVKGVPVEGVSLKGVSVKDLSVKVVSVDGAYINSGLVSNLRSFNSSTQCLKASITTGFTFFSTSLLVMACTIKVGYLKFMILSSGNSFTTSVVFKKVSTVW